MLTTNSEISFVDRLLRQEAAEANLADLWGQIETVRDIVFRDFIPIWQGHDFKFDVSLSCGLDAPPSLRFSYNNYGEVDTFRAKIEQVFSLYPGAYDLQVKDKVLDIMEPTNHLHQTTLGFEWTDSAQVPRIKIYFEELPQGYCLEDRWKLARALGIASGCTNPPPRDNIAAIAVDFLSGGRCSTKWYSRFESPDEIVKSLDVYQGRFSSLLYDISAVLNYEHRAFYYLTHRYLENRLSSLKVYKIYEFAQFDDCSSADSEIENLLLESARASDRLHLAHLRSICHNHGYAAFPAILSIDYSSEGRLKIDVYYGFRQKMKGPR